MIDYSTRGTAGQLLSLTHGYATKCRASWSRSGPSRSTRHSRHSMPLRVSLAACSGELLSMSMGSRAGSITGRDRLTSPVASRVGTAHRFVECHRTLSHVDCSSEAIGNHSE